ncbi:hypothetical protein HanHA300_Chr17g0671861 [Helianthus annuus]|nr:hypothetical protein HanHA300_Chr17g0671861 [Helianthus annuus]KAJ0634006.1 hypothetical protein HanLR1_Chr17g0683191 [Helianthus annuus]
MFLDGCQRLSHQGIKINPSNCEPSDKVKDLRSESEEMYCFPCKFRGDQW